MTIRKVGFGLLAMCFLWTVALAVPGCPKKSRTPDVGGDDEEPLPRSPGTAISPEKMREVQGVFKSGSANVQECFQRLVERKKDPKLKGTIIVGVTIGVSKNPEKVWFYKIEPRLDEARFKQCVRQVVGGWEFPLLGGQFDLTSPRYFLEVY